MLTRRRPTVRPGWSTRCPARMPKQTFTGALRPHNIALSLPSRALGGVQSSSVVESRLIPSKPPRGLRLILSWDQGASAPASLIADQHGRLGYLGLSDRRRRLQPARGNSGVLERLLACPTRPWVQLTDPLRDEHPHVQSHSTTTTYLEPFPLPLMSTSASVEAAPAPPSR